LKICSKFEIRSDLICSDFEKEKKKMKKEKKKKKNQWKETGPAHRPRLVVRRLVRAD
jgi:hypothetical protein